MQIGKYDVVACVKASFKLPKQKGFKTEVLKPFKATSARS